MQQEPNKTRGSHNKRKKVRLARYSIVILTTITIGVLVYTQIQIASTKEVENTQASTRLTTQSENSTGLKANTFINNKTAITAEENTEDSSRYSDEYSDEYSEEYSEEYIDESTEGTESSTFEKTQPRLDNEPYADFMMEEVPAEPATEQLLQGAIEELDTASLNITWGNLVYYLKQGLLEPEGYTVTEIELQSNNGKVFLKVIPNTPEKIGLGTIEQQQELQDYKVNILEPLVSATVVGVERWYQGEHSIDINLEN